MGRTTNGKDELGLADRDERALITKVIWGKVLVFGVLSTFIFVSAILFKTTHGTGWALMSGILILWMTLGISVRIFSTYGRRSLEAQCPSPFSKRVRRRIYNTWTLADDQWIVLADSADR